MQPAGGIEFHLDAPAHARQFDQHLRVHVEGPRPAAGFGDGEHVPFDRLAAFLPDRVRAALADTQKPVGPW